MSYFSELLTFYSKRIGINSPQIAGYCNLDRVTVYRFMKGKTLPKDRETVMKMAEVLRLARDEKDALIEAYECTQLGPHVYWEKKYIRSFIQSFTGMPSMIRVIQYDTDDLKDPDRETLVISGRDDTIKRIQKAILDECEKPQCEIDLIMRSGINAVMDMLLSAGKKNRSLKVKHLMPVTIDILADDDNDIPGAMIADESFPDFDRKENHELLQNMFKVIRMCAEGFDYEPSYYYTRQEETGQFPEYSNLLITGNAVILFTNNLKESILFTASDHVASFREKYHRHADDKPLLFYFYQDLNSLINIMNHFVIEQELRMDEPEYNYFSLPCAIPFLTKEIVDRHLRSEMITQTQCIDEDILETVYSYINAISSLYYGADSREINYISESGIRFFMKTGRFAEVPMELYSPLTEEERRQMILTMAEHPNYKFYLLKEQMSSPEGMLCIEVLYNTLLIVFNIPNKGMCYLFSNEPGIFLAFRNYFRDLRKEEYYSEEESREILRKIAREEIK